MPNFTKMSEHLQCKILAKSFLLSGGFFKTDSGPVSPPLVICPVEAEGRTERLGVQSITDHAGSLKSLTRQIKIH